MNKDLKSLKKFSLPVNIIFTKKDINKYQNINLIPLLILFLSMLIFGKIGYIKFGLFLVIIAFLYGFVFGFFSRIYVNGRIYFSNEGFYLKRRGYFKFIAWGDIKNISFYQNSDVIESIPPIVMYIQLNDPSKYLIIYLNKYLFRSPRFFYYKTVALLSVIPEARQFLPKDLDTFYPKLPGPEIEQNVGFPGKI